MYDFLKGSESIKADAGLRKRVGKNFMSYKIKTTVKTIGISAAAVLAAVTVSANVSSDLAFAMSDIPVLGTVVRVVTLERYSKKIGGAEAEIVIPRLEGLADDELMEQINSELAENAKELAKQFETDARELNEQSGGEGHMGVQYDYTVRTDTDKYYAIDIYLFNAVGSSSTVHKFYTIDRNARKLVTLPELFASDADYVGVLSEYIKAEMERINAEEGGLFFVEENEFGDGFKGISPEQSFFINENDELVICFDKYEVAAGAQGSPEFVIPSDVIGNILENGSL